MLDLPPVSVSLQERGIAHRVFRHVQPVTSLAEAAAARGQTPEQVVRSILFRLGGGQYALALMAGERQVSWQALRAYFGQSRLSMASEAEVLQVTGYAVGTVSPVGVSEAVRIVADPGVFAVEEISLGSGERNVAILMMSKDLHLAVNRAIEVSVL
jgi:prolyl-tRNA editing enzyme YbaK/EbsC (Cys-tRNA(Pro) deacylase)